jgi:hypothetical protein
MEAVMKRYLAILATAMMVACGGNGDDDDDGTDVSGDDDDDNACANSILGQFPENGDTDVYYRTDVRFTLAAADSAASVTVADAAGTEVSGTVSMEGTVVTWTGGPLMPDTDYSVTLSYECGDATVSWKTSGTGGDTVDVTGKVYNLDLTSGEWVQPAGVGDLLATQLDGVQVLIMPTDVNTEITMLGALGDGNGQQDLCTESIPFPAAAYDNPYFELASPLLPLDIAGFVIEVEDLELSGAFSPSGDRIQGAVLKGKVDTRPLVDLIAPGGGDTAVCDLVSTFGVACEACGGGGDYCLSLWVANIEAGELPSANALVLRTADDIAADQACK